MPSTVQCTIHHSNSSVVPGQKAERIMKIKKNKSAPTFQNRPQNFFRHPAAAVMAM